MMTFGASFLLVFLTGILCDHGVSGSSHNVHEDVGVTELRSMLAATMEQNRKLEQQNRRLKLIWNGLQQMCTGLQLNTCSEDTSTYTESKRLQPFRLLSISSSGLREDGCVVLNASYRAPLRHSIEWLQVNDIGIVLRTSGSKTEHSKGTSEIMYTSAASMCDVDGEDRSTVMLRLYADNETTSVRFNSNILQNSSQDIPQRSTVLLEFNPTYQAVANEDLNVTLIVNGSLHVETVNDALRSLQVYFQAVNALSEPPSMIEYPIAEFETRATQRNGTTSNIVITLTSDLVQHGGMLYVSLPQTPAAGNMIEDLRFGIGIHILSPSTRKVVPDNTFAVHQLPSQSLLHKPSHSITCGTMGRPVPELNIFKRMKDGSERKMESEVVIDQDYVVVRCLTLPPNRKAAGQYICRATQDNRTLESTTDAIVHVPLKFDEKKTALLRNTTRKTVISCKASGVPRPELELTGPYGDAFNGTSQFKISRSGSKKRTARIILTVEPADTSISQVTCRASQAASRYQRYQRYREIPVFPSNFYGANYTFVEEVMSAK